MVSYPLDQSDLKTFVIHKKNAKLKERSIHSNTAPS